MISLVAAAIFASTAGGPTALRAVTARCPYRGTGMPIGFTRDPLERVCDA